MKPEYLIIHHSATARDTTTFEAVKAGHIKKGWGDIGYHFFITADGVLHEGRGQDQIGAHCIADRMNYRSLGICLAGNFETEQPAKKQVETLKGIVGQLKEIWKIPAENILGHSEVKGAATACPGKNLMPFVLGLRQPENTSPDAQNALLLTIANQRQEIGQLKQKNNQLTNKLTNARNMVKELKVAVDSSQSWLDKLIAEVKKNGQDS